VSALPSAVGAPCRAAFVAALGRAGLATLVLTVAELALATLRAESLGVAAHASRLAPAAFGVAGVASLAVAMLLLVLRAVAVGGRRTRTDARRVAVAAFVVTAPLIDVLCWRLTSGRRAQMLPARALLVALVALLVAGFVSALAAGWWRERRRASARSRALAGASLIGVVFVAGVVDQRVFPRNYVDFHVALGVLAALAVGVAADVVALPGRAGSLASRVGGVVAIVAVVVAGPALWALRLAPGPRYAAEQLAPLTGKAVAALRRATPRPLPTPSGPPPIRAAAPVTTPAVASFAPPERAVLLITIDALRADALAAYGGRGLTPNLDELAREGVVFRRAYTPTPHTSHALGSLFTGTYLRAVLALGADRAARPTLASRLHEAGVRTAAFYPPAVFFVDADALGPLRTSGFGFAEREEGWASADGRARQVEAWLARTPAAAPVFVWAHLFEPHEPYEPPPAFARGDSERARYDGEVAAADAGVAALVRAFRAQRPRGTVIVTADHGEEFGEHGARFHGTSLFDEQARVPLVWSTPGAVRPAVIDAPVELVDLAPTLLAAFGVAPDSRMRGDDLGALLRGTASPAPRFAFATLGEEWMVTDGRLKALCVEHDDACRLYDLQADPRELHDVSEARAEELTPLREALGALLVSIPRVEAMDDVRAPLARARLGDRSAVPALIALLDADEASLRAEAAAALGGLRVAAALPRLQQVFTDDPDATVRAEAALAALWLGDDAVHDAVALLVARATPCTADGGDCAYPANVGLARRAALTLAARGDATGVDVLRELARDASARMEERAAAVRALGPLRVRASRRDLEALLDDLTLRTDAAEALGRLGDPAAGDALVAASLRERYPAARLAEARALVSLRDRRAPALVRAALGGEEPLTDGVALLLASGALRRADADGAQLVRAPAARRGAWRCASPADADGDAGCTPGEGAHLVLPSSSDTSRARRLLLRVTVAATPEESGAATLAIEGLGDVRHLAPGAQELCFELPAEGLAPTVPVRVTGPVSLVAFVVVPRSPAP
jgi:arylsulfatase A-like enzyme